MEHAMGKATEKGIIFLLFILLFVSSACCQAVSQSTNKNHNSVAKDSSKVATEKPVEQSLSPNFKRKAWMAIDAIQRLRLSPLTPSFSKIEPGIEYLVRASLFNDAQKAVDEAKYESSTALDKYVLRALQGAMSSTAQQMIYPVLDPNWKSASDQYLQCSVEAEVYIEPEVLSDTGFEQARLGTCGKKVN